MEHVETESERAAAGTADPQENTAPGPRHQPHTESDAHVGDPSERRWGSAGERVLQEQLGTQQRAGRFYDEQMLGHLNARMREFVGRQEMLFLATSDRNGECDSSFRAGAPGFVQVLDEHTVAYPEFRGNGVLASLGNIEENPHVALLLLDFQRDRIGLHINGRARVVADDAMRERHAHLPVDPVPGRRAAVWVEVTVEEAYVHCSKHIPHLAKVERTAHGEARAGDSDDHRRKGGDYFGAAADARARRGQSRSADRRPAPDPHPTTHRPPAHRDQNLAHQDPEDLPPPRPPYDAPMAERQPAPQRHLITQQLPPPQRPRATERPATADHLTADHLTAERHPAAPPPEEFAAERVAPDPLTGGWPAPPHAAAPSPTWPAPPAPPHTARHRANPAPPPPAWPPPAGPPLPAWPPAPPHPTAGPAPDGQEEPHVWQEAVERVLDRARHPRAGDEDEARQRPFAGWFVEPDAPARPPSEAAPPPADPAPAPYGDGAPPGYAAPHAYAYPPPAADPYGAAPAPTTDAFPPTAGPPPTAYDPPDGTYGRSSGEASAQPGVPYGPPDPAYGSPHTAYAPADQPYRPPTDAYGYEYPNDTYGQRDDACRQPTDTYATTVDAYGQPVDIYGLPDAGRSLAPPPRADAEPAPPVTVTWPPGAPDR
ncbi:pyridoxamine 5'-phosphate oxidase family protein [Streptomyces sp. NPDC057702]|uniref:pyridoxamine 5'-phosphate oxidase family protein n=1 Tax=unclassified Streptomyces TaxID=2593676 RepID=UPI00367866F8